MTDRAPEGALATADCVNCGAPRAGRYCAACGQPEFPGRLTVGSVCRRLVANAFDLERGLLHTFRELLRRPGAVAADYVRGRTVDYANPVKYFIIAVTLAQLVALRVGAVDEFVRGLLAGFGAVSEGRPAFAHPQLVESLSSYAIALGAPAVILMAACTRLLFRRAGRNYAENLVFGLFVSAQLLFALALMMPLLNARKSVAVPALLMMFIASAGYYTWAAAVFFGSRPASAAPRAILAAALTAVSYTGLMIFLLASYVAAR